MNEQNDDRRGAVAGPVDRPVSRPSNLDVLLRPSFWMRNYRTCEYMSAFINAALDAGEVPEVVDLHHMRLAGRLLWRANYPYAYASYNDEMPDRKTVIRLARAQKAAEWRYKPANVRAKRLAEGESATSARG